MKITSNLLGAGALSMLLCLSACDNDDNSKPSSGNQLSKADAKAALSNFNSQASTDLQDLGEAEGLLAVRDFFTLVDQDDPFGRIGTDQKGVRAFFRTKGQEFRSVFSPVTSSKGRTSAEESFDFDAKKGVYEWNEELQAFELTAQSTAIKIKFPTEGSLSNNAELQLLAYADVEITDDETGETYYEPTSLKAELYTDNVKAAGLDLEVEYDEAGFPLTADVAVSVTPFTASLSVDVTNSTSSSISVSLREGQETIIATSIVAKYGDSSKSEESLETLEGFVQFKSLKLQGNVDLTAANGENVDLNSIVKLALYSDNKKVGDIVFVTENAQDVAYVKYADGSKEKLEDVLKPVADEISELGESLQVNG